MKTPVRLFAALFFLSAAQLLFAQGCRLDYTPNYAEYATMSTDGTYIYTSVLTDGSTSGNPSAGCNYPNARHTAQSYNTIGGTGGWVYGTPGYMTSYLSVTNNQQIAGTPGTVYLFSDEGEVICTQFGTFFNASYGGFSPFPVTFSVSYGNLLDTTTSGSSVICQYETWCTSLPKGQTLPTCPPDGGDFDSDHNSPWTCRSTAKFYWLSYTDKTYGFRVCAAHEVADPTQGKGPYPCS